MRAVPLLVLRKYQLPLELPAKKQTPPVVIRNNSGLPAKAPIEEFDGISVIGSQLTDQSGGIGILTTN
ncbi:unnamed protein product [Cylicocyclus nassatus]|uniref:Uncharacterized protein n=1 Tax=Cylicocyclus nassatus TaxID=53992 RepID=A0AA36H0Y0_CYLNA|nr:unnamed protein product [Cylicocyclus nassatus]